MLIKHEKETSWKHLAPNPVARRRPGPCRMSSSGKSSQAPHPSQHQQATTLPVISPQHWHFVVTSRLQTHFSKSFGQSVSLKCSFVWIQPWFLLGAFPQPCSSFQLHDVSRSHQRFCHRLYFIHAFDLSSSASLQASYIATSQLQWSPVDDDSWRFLKAADLCLVHSWPRLTLQN